MDAVQGLGRPEMSHIITVAMIVFLVLFVFIAISSWIKEQGRMKGPKAGKKEEGETDEAEQEGEPTEQAEAERRAAEQREPERRTETREPERTEPPERPEPPEDRPRSERPSEGYFGLPPLPEPVRVEELFGRAQMMAQQRHGQMEAVRGLQDQIRESIPAKKPLKRPKSEMILTLAEINEKLREDYLKYERLNDEIFDERKILLKIKSPTPKDEKRFLEKLHEAISDLSELERNYTIDEAVQKFQELKQELSGARGQVFETRLMTQEAKEAALSVLEGIGKNVDKMAHFFEEAS
jgi:hypothetical protein